MTGAPRKSGRLTGAAGRAALGLALLLALLPLRTADASGKAVIGGLKIKFTDWEVLSVEEMVEAVRDDIEAFLKYGRKTYYLEDAAYHLKARLWEAGRPFAKVKYLLAENGLRLRFVMEPGKETVLERVDFEGNKLFAADELEKAFAAERIFPVLEGRRLYVESRVEDGAGIIRGRYRARGYLWARVDVARTDFLEEGTRAHVLVRIAEGRQALVSGVVFEGNRLVGTPVLRDRMGPIVGKPFSPDIPLDVRNALLSYYAEQGYPFARVTVAPLIHAERAEVEVHIRIREGRCAYLRRIILEGNGLTWDSVVRHIAGWKRGDRFSIGRIRKSYNDLTVSGLFRGVDIQPLRVKDDPESVDLSIRVDEADNYKTELDFGFGTYEWLIGSARLRDVNFLGSGRQLWVGGKASFRELRAEAGVLDPWVLNLPFDGSFRGYAGRRIETNFSEFRWGMNFTFGFPLAEAITAKISYDYRFTDVYKAEEGIDITAARNLNVSSVGFQLLLDWRDSPLDPRWGIFFDLSHTFAGRGLGGHVRFDRSILKSCIHLSPLPGFTLSLYGEASIIDPKSLTETIPLQLRFFRGGLSSVRSFGERELGPKNADGVEIGGEAYLQANAELSLRFGELWDLLFPDKEEEAEGLKPGGGRRFVDFGVAVFVDTGSLKENAAYWLDLTGFRHAIGFGLRLYTPVGPMRLDFGFNPDRRSGEDAMNVHFTIGYLF
jgi:outer membrane protein insertion porin family